MATIMTGAVPLGICHHCRPTVSLSTRFMAGGFQTPVNDADYQIPFTFTGKLNKITLTLDRPQLSHEDIKKLQAAQREKRAGD